MNELKIYNAATPETKAVCVLPNSKVKSQKRQSFDAKGAVPPNSGGAGPADVRALQQALSRATETYNRIGWLCILDDLGEEARDIGERLRSLQSDIAVERCNELPAEMLLGVVPCLERLCECAEAIQRSRGELLNAISLVSSLDGEASQLERISSNIRMASKRRSKTKLPRVSDNRDPVS